MIFKLKVTILVYTVECVYYVCKWKRSHDFQVKSHDFIYRLKVKILVQIIESVYYVYKWTCATNISLLHLHGTTANSTFHFPYT